MNKSIVAATVSPGAATQAPAEHDEDRGGVPFADDCPFPAGFTLFFDGVGKIDPTPHTQPPDIGE